MRTTSVIAAALVAALSACTASSSSTVTVAPAPTPRTPNEVVIYEYKYVPATLTVSRGTKVTWVNYDIAPHTATHRTYGDEPFDSGNLQVQQLFSHIFKVPGTYDYICVLHQGMRGSVIVQ